MLIEFNILFGFKGVLVKTADRTYPVIRKILESSSRSNSSLRIANFRIIYITVGIRHRDHFRAEFLRLADAYARAIDDELTRLRERGATE